MKKKQQSTSKIVVRKPNALLNAIVRCGVKLWLKRRIKFKFTRNVRKLDHPAIVLCNHGSFIDFAYMALLLGRDKPHIVATRQYFYNKRLGRLLLALGCIPKSLFATDVESVKNCIKVVNDGGVLVLCPEARLSTVGQFQDIQPGTMGFLHKMGKHATIYTIKFSGDYLAMPKWARRGDKRFIRKKSVVEATLDVLFAKGECAGVTAEEFESRVRNALQYNDFDWLQQRPNLTYPQGNLADGLENVLYKCPNCGGEFTLSARGDTLECGSCGFADTMDVRYQFANSGFANLQQWYHWQMNELSQAIESNPNFELRDRVTLYHPSLDGKMQLRVAGEGECVFNRHGLTYTGTDSDKQIVKHFPLNTIYRLMFGAGADFEIYEGDNFWYFVPSDGRTCVKWYMASEVLCG